MSIFFSSLFRKVALASWAILILTANVNAIGFTSGIDHFKTILQVCINLKPDATDKDLLKGGKPACAFEAKRYLNALNSENGEFGIRQANDAIEFLNENNGILRNLNIDNNYIEEAKKFLREFNN